MITQDSSQFTFIKFQMNYSSIYQTIISHQEYKSYVYGLVLQPCKHKEVANRKPTCYLNVLQLNLLLGYNKY